MPAIVQNHIVVREHGTPWSETIAEQSHGSDRTVVFLQQHDESTPELAARVVHGVQKIQRGKEWLRSAVIACNAQCDPQTIHTRYRLARRVLERMHHPGPARLVLFVDKGGKRAMKAMLSLVKRLARDMAGNVAVQLVST